MGKDISSRTDLKDRFGGVLENPYISKIQRHCMDGFKVAGLKGIIRKYTFSRFLDVGCGLGEYSRLSAGRYHGVDNSFPRILFAQRRARHARFLVADANRLPFRSKSFDAVLLANTSHHLSDDQFMETLREMARVSSRYILVDDAVLTPNQNPLSRYVYRLDRGTQFRTIPQIRSLLQSFSGVSIIQEGTHRTFPGLYIHAVFVMENRHPPGE